MKSKAKVIRADEAKKDVSYDPPLQCFWGINDETTGHKTKIAVLRAVWPPGKRNAVHLHKFADNGMYVLRGKARLYVGEDREVLTCKAGDFIYIPAGEIHMVENASDEEEVEVIGIYGGVSNESQAGNVWIERPAV